MAEAWFDPSKVKPMSNMSLYNGDCLDVMQSIASQSVDLVVTSPPYDEMREYNKFSEWSFSIFEKIANELTRVLKDGATIVWIVADQTKNGSESCSSFKQAIYFKEMCCLNLHDTMIWQNPGFTAVGSLKTRYASVFEYMFIFTKGKIKTFNPIKDKPNITHGREIKGTTRLANGDIIPKSSTGKITSEFGQRYNVWQNTHEINRNIKHPAPFPVNLIEDHIKSWSNSYDLILDPFLGSGTTGVACQNTNRHFIGIENDKTYFDAAYQRIIDNR
jgi:DNA modification methylase